MRRVQHRSGLVRAARRGLLRHVDRRPQETGPELVVVGRVEGPAHVLEAFDGQIKRKLLHVGRLDVDDLDLADGRALAAALQGDVLAPK